MEMRSLLIKQRNGVMIPAALHLLLCVFSFMLFCCNAYNPTFRNFLPDSNDSIKYPPRDKNPGSFSWDIRFPAGKVQAAKSFIEISSDAGGADILEVARLSLETSPISGSKELPAGTYFFRLRLANDLSTVVFGGVINVQVGEVTSFIRNYSDADFKPFVNLLVNLQADSFIPVTPVEATVEFYDNSSAAGAAMANVNGTSDTRHIPAAALGQVFRSEGWTALPNDQFDPQYPAQFWAKLILTDNAGRQFIKIRGPYTTTGQELEIGIGAAAASFTELNIQTHNMPVRRQAVKCMYLQQQPLAMALTKLKFKARRFLTRIPKFHISLERRQPVNIFCGLCRNYIQQMQRLQDSFLQFHFLSGWKMHRIQTTITK